jgi:3-methylcrotonyl-CoA carboxylase alpha subunit
MPMFHKILIANRGEIACRVAATARRLGVRTVAVFSEADANARHVRACDQAVGVGGAAPRDSYLRWERIVQAALDTGAQAVHPGYGFLSENEAFATACAQAGLVFIGPPPAAIAAMGSKSAAKSLMAQAGVPLVPGYHGQDNAPALLQREADRIGYPVLIKASAGGGGKGMRRVDRAADFAAALASCQREAKASFGDDHVLIERYVTRPRHVEIQVFADAHGHCIHLNERDCSVQRRHQKVLEEAPAPGLSAERRAQMGAAAVAAARAVGYVGAGTVEFIAEPTPAGDLNFYFMEMNTRLQVEHPVTEAVTGFDLVEWQLRVAAGEALPVPQEAVRIHGHAIEARICAENPDAQFLPAIGTLSVARWPSHVAFAARSSGDLNPAPVRIDRGFDEGDAITPHYDSMIAKLIVWGADRRQALARLDAALAQTQLVGLHTNVAFLRRVVQSESFANANLDTALIERERAALFEAPPLSPLVVAAAVAAQAQAQEAQHTLAQKDHDPWSQRDGWRLHGAARRVLRLQQGAAPVEQALIERHPNGEMHVQIGTERLRWAATARGGDAFSLTVGEQTIAVHVHAVGDQRAVFAPAAAGQGYALITLVDPASGQAQGAGTGDGAHAGGLVAPMPGKVVAVHVKAGDAVKQGQALAVMEAMKMEHTLAAPRDGEVAAVHFGPGDVVGEGAALLSLTPMANA